MPGLARRVERLVVHGGRNGPRRAVRRGEGALPPGLRAPARAQVCGQPGIHRPGVPAGGDIPGAIAALEEEVAVLAEQWDTRTGETVDKVRREIARLKAL